MSVNMVQISIATKKRKLIATAKKKGLWENFGQNEVRKLQDVYVDISSYTDEMNKIRECISQFNNWCMNFDLSQLKE